MPKKLNKDDMPPKAANLTAFEEITPMASAHAAQNPLPLIAIYI
jgi:hypothetical protein